MSLNNLSFLLKPWISRHRVGNDQSICHLLCTPVRREEGGGERMGGKGGEKSMGSTTASSCLLFSLEVC